MMVFIYARVSTPGQEDNYSFQAQKERGEAFASSIASPRRLYSDVESGAKLNRKDWQRLLQDLRDISEPGDVVWYGSQSRIMRDAEEFQAFKKLVMSKRLRAYEDKDHNYLDFSQSSGDRIKAGVMSIIDEEERNTIRQRMFDGLKGSWDAGRRVHPKIYGYDGTKFDEKGERIWTINKEEAEVVKRVFSLYAKGTPVHAIARTLNDRGYRNKAGNTWTNSRINRFFGHIVYSGRTVNSHREVIPSEIYPAIIKPEVFDSVTKARFYRQEQHQKGRPPRWEGSGIFKCPLCNSPFHVQPINGNRYYHHKEQSGCKGPKVRKLEVCNLILELAYSIALVQYPEDTFRHFREQSKSEESHIHDDITRIEKLIAAAEKARDNFSAAIAKGKATDYFVEQVAKKITEIGSLSRDRERLVVSLSHTSENLEELISHYSLANLSAFYALTNREERRNMLAQVIKVGWIQNDGILVQLMDGRKLLFDYKAMLKERNLTEGSIALMNPIRFVFESQVMEWTEAERTLVLKALNRVTKADKKWITLFASESQMPCG